MNLLAIFSSLVPDGEKAWLPGGFSARVFFFFFTFNEDDDVRLLSKIGEQRGIKKRDSPEEE